MVLALCNSLVTTKDPCCRQASATKTGVIRVTIYDLCSGNLAETKLETWRNRGKQNLIWGITGEVSKSKIFKNML